jgi:hypothetical protein
MEEVHEMSERKSIKGLDFETLRHAIERCNPELVLGFYAEDAQLSIINAEAQRSIPFELCGKAEIAKHLRAVYGQETSHRVEQEIVGEERVTFREACEYPDGSRVVVTTTLALRDGKIVRQVDVVAQGTQADRHEEISQEHPYSKTHLETHPGVDTLPTGDLS